MFGTGVDVALDTFSEIEQHGGSEIEGNLFMVEAWKSRKRELRFLKMILWCFESWNFAEGKQRFVLTDVNDLWEGSQISTDLLNDEVAALESKIHKSKVMLLEQYCTGDLSNCSIWTQLDTSEMLKFLDLILQNLESLLMLKADEIVPCFNQFQIPQEKLTLLHRYLWFAIAGCKDGKESKDLKIDVHTFANRAACLVFLCWVTEGDQRVKLNLMLSDILKDFINPCFPDECAFLFGAPVVEKWQQSEDTFLLRRTVAHFIDVLISMPPDCTDRWEIRHDGRMFFSTFMADPLKGSVQYQQFTLISSQIDVFLYKGFSLMLLGDDMLQEDCDKEKMFLHDYAAEVDIIKGQITQLYIQIHSPHSDTDQTSSSSEGSKQSTSSDVEDSWLTFSSRTCVDPVLDALSQIKEEGSSEIEEEGGSEIEGLTRELRFLKMTLLCFEAWDHSAEKLNANQTSMLTILEDVWKGLEMSMNFGDLESKIKQSKLLVQEYCGHDLLYCSFKCGSMTTGEMFVFLDLILQNLKDLEYRGDDVGPLLKQIKILQHKLMLLQNFFQLAIHGCIDDSWQVEAFTVNAHTFADCAARLVFLCWVKEADEASTTTLSFMLSDMLQGFIKPSIPNVWALYFGVLKALKCRGSHDTLLLGQTVANFIDLLLENQVIPSTDSWHILFGMG